MKIEKEIKILGIDPEKLRRRLVKLGAKLQFKSVIREVAFDSDFLEKGVTLRLRIVGGKNELTAKKKKLSSRLLMREEYEVQVSDFEETARILGVLGFSKIRDREKEREEWILGEAKVEIDRYPGMPPYAEIEAKDRQTIMSCLRKLGLSNLRRTTQTSTELLKSWGAKNPNYLKF